VSDKVSISILQIGRKAQQEPSKALTDYGTYEMSLFEKVFNTAIAAVVISIIAFIFYRNFIFSVILMPFALLYPRYKTSDIIKKRIRELNIEFKDMLYSLSSSLSAGKSVEGAFRDVLRDLAVLYPDSKAFIMKEVECIVRRLEMNETIETVLADFARRAHLEDLNNFVDVFSICKRTGGNIVEVIKNTSAIINDRIEVRQEIDTMLAERRFEQKILNVVPIFLVIVLSASAADYMEPVFETAAGKLVTSISIILLVAAYLISKRIIDVRL
jgi:tight adherence protein B